MGKKSKKAKETNHMLVAEWEKQIIPYLLDFKRMENRLTCSIKQYEGMVAKLPNGAVWEINHAPNAQTWSFIDNGADVLGVAHLDATGVYPHFAHALVGGPGGDHIVWSRWLDDRLGVFLLLDVLPHFCKYDILLTTGEETGQSTAKQFVPPDGKKYRFMFEPDRMGSDCVHYQYDTAQMMTALRAAGFTTLSHGAFTDICSLERLGCAGFNFGIGYHDNHGDESYAKLSETLHGAARFCNFFEQNMGVSFPFDPKVDGNKNRWNSYGAHTPAGGSYFYQDEGKYRFKRDTVVKVLATGELMEITGTGITETTTVNAVATSVVKYWCRYPIKPTPVGKAGMYCYDVDITAELTILECKEAKADFLNGKVRRAGSTDDHDLIGLWDVKFETGEDGFTQRIDGAAILPKANASVVVIGEKPDALTAPLPPLTVGSKHDSAYMRELAKRCDRPCHLPDVIEARDLYELAQFGEDLQSGSHQIPSLAMEASKPLGRILFFNDEVHTASGIGKIDARNPVYAGAYGIFWWVRFLIPDGMGTYCDLVEESELTLRTSVTRPITSVAIRPH